MCTFNGERSPSEIFFCHWAPCSSPHGLKRESSILALRNGLSSCGIQPAVWNQLWNLYMAGAGYTGSMSWSAIILLWHTDQVETVKWHNLLLSSTLRHRSWFQKAPEPSPLLTTFSSYLWLKGYSNVTASIPSIQARVQLEGTFKTLKICSSWWIEKCVCVCVTLSSVSGMSLVLRKR